MKSNLQTILISIAVSLISSYAFTLNLSNKIGDKEIVKETEKVVSVTESDTIQSSVTKIYDATILVESYRNKKLVSSGTGFIYKKDDDFGYIITNYHVIDDADAIKIVDNYGNSVEGTLLGSDEYVDIAIIKIDKESVLQVAEIGKSEELKIGDTLFTVGTPVDHEYIGTVTKGILSGKNRLIDVELSSGSYMLETLQTDAAINPGNSGGPLVNINGEVIGVNSLKLVEDKIEGMGFAIPIETVMEIVDELEKGETIVRPYLGVQFINVTDKYQLFVNRINISEKVEYGAVIVYAEEDRPAEKSGLKKGDVIIEFNGKRVEDISAVKYELFKCKIDDTVKVKVYRDDEIKEIKIKLTDKVE